jgi:cell division protein FtsQ
MLWNAFYNKIIRYSISFGFQIQKISIQGRVHCPRVSLQKTMENYYKKPLFDCSLDSLREDIENLDWIEQCCVARRYPHEVYISIRERQPIAFWSDQRDLYLVDAKGEKIRMDDGKAPKAFQKLPFFSGEDAPIHAQSLLDQMRHYPKLEKRINHYVFVRKRRWDLVLDKKIRVKLPQGDINASLQNLQQFLEIAQNHLKHLQSIDLRVPKKIICQFTELGLLSFKNKGSDA